MNSVLDALPSEHRTLIVEELTHRNPDLLTELRGAQNPTNSQSDAVVDALAHALSANCRPGHVPNQYGLAVERTIDAYLEAWPIYR